MAVGENGGGRLLSTWAHTLTGPKYRGLSCLSTRGRVLVFRPRVESFAPGSSLSTRGQVFRSGVESESFDPGSSLSTRGRDDHLNMVFVS